jgi:hypothetical protein
MWLVSITGMAASSTRLEQTKADGTQLPSPSYSAADLRSRQSLGLSAWPRRRGGLGRSRNYPPSRRAPNPDVSASPAPPHRVWSTSAGCAVCRLRGSYNRLRCKAFGCRAAAPALSGAARSFSRSSRHLTGSCTRPMRSPGDENPQADSVGPNNNISFRWAASGRCCAAVNA